MQTRRNQPCDVRHVDHEVGANRIGYLAEPGEVERPRVRGRARDDELGLVLECETSEHVVVDDLGLLIDAVVDDVVEHAGETDGVPVRQMAAV